MMQKKEVPVIQIENGKISGRYNADQSVCTYKGIPYAANPVGELRWKAPRKRENWEGIRDCSEFGPSAVQTKPEPFMFWTEEFLIDKACERSEDCLNLSVWTPNDEKEDKPVLVFIHGGGFSSGGCSCEIYNGEMLAKMGIVYVSIQYRLGTLGYLVHSELKKEGEKEIFANYGFLDQIAALEWIKRNIVSFGGDSDNITISGESAGAASVDMLMASPLAAGLFQRAVSISMPTIILDLPDVEEAREAGERVFPNETAEQMRQMSAREVLKRRVPSMCIDKRSVPLAYEDAIKHGAVNRVPLMVGMTLGDGPLLYLMEGDCKTLDDYKQFVKNQFGKLAENCLQLYPAKDDNIKEVMTLLQRDYLISIMDYEAKLREENVQEDTWCFLFTHTMPGKNLYGAFHTSDMPYFFNTLSDSRKEYWKQEDYELANRMSSYLINFVKEGDPNGEGLEHWEKNHDGHGTMELNSEGKMMELSKEKRELFQKLLETKKIAPAVNMKAAES